MFNKIKVKYLYECNGMLNFEKFEILEQMLCLSNGKYNYSHISNKMGFNNSILLKESPFHYPIAKKVLNNTKKNIVIENCYNLKKKLPKSYLDIKSLEQLVALDTPCLNSLYTIKASKISVFIDYTPTL